MRVETIISLRRSNIAASLLPLTCELSITLQRMVCCIAFGCNNKDGDRKRGVRFHRLPLRNKPLLKQWLTSFDYRILLLDVVAWSAVNTSNRTVFNEICKQNYWEQNYEFTSSQMLSQQFSLSPPNENNDQQDRNEDTIRLLFTVCFNQPVT